MDKEVNEPAAETHAPSRNMATENANARDPAFNTSAPLSYPTATFDMYHAREAVEHSYSLVPKIGESTASVWPRQNR